MWEVLGKSADPSVFDPLEPLETLYEFDGPRVFTFKDRDDELFLAYQCGQDNGFWRYLLVPFTDALVRQLTKGDLSVRDALNQPRAWLLDVDADWKPFRAWKVELASMPARSLPELGTMLLPSLEPLISLRVVGERLHEGAVPGSIISAAAEGVKRALKILVEYVLDRNPLSGRPASFVRRLYDLPAQGLAFRSFEISFRRPLLSDQDECRADSEEETLVFRQVGELLQKGLRWADSTDANVTVFPGEDAEQRAILQAMMSLAPPAVGAVRAVEIRGELVSELVCSTRRAIRLERGTRRRIKEALTQIHADREEIVAPVGVIREADRDRYTFELREIVDTAGAMKFTFEEAIAEDVLAAFNDEYQVKVAGVRRSGANAFEALRVERYGL